MIIDCGSCTVAGAACDDCVVTVLLGHPSHLSPPNAAVASAEIPDEHAKAVAVLAETGLIPPLRLVTRAS
jgi:hypothetical protein